jgi:signal transduction histidine kinase
MVGGPRTIHAGGILGDRLRLRSLTLISGWLAPAVFAAVLCTALALLLSRLQLGTTPAGLSRVNDVARTVASALFVTAGVLRLTRWRVHGDVRSAVMGSALVLLGGFCFPLVTVARLLADAEEGSVLATLTRALVTIVVIGIVWRVFADEDRLWPSTLIVRRAVVILAGFLLLVGLSTVGATRFLVGFPVHVVFPAALASAWIVLGVRATLLADTHLWAGRVAPLLGAMGVAELLRAFDRGVDGTWTLAALALNVSVGTITTVCALRDLNEAAEQRSLQTSGLVTALERASGTASDQQAWREEMTHDATNALTALRGALLTLHRYDGRLDRGTVGRLRSAAIEEVHHLEHLILATEQQPVQVFDAWDTVCAVTATQQVIGLDITVSGASAPARGRPGDVSTALTNLLVNAAVHAKGSPVKVDVTTDRNRVLVAVSDRGPGLTAAEAVRVFSRGARGPESPGSGLGLHVARTVMRNQGGDVELRSRDGGATFVISIPTAPTTDRQPSAPALTGISL